MCMFPCVCVHGMLSPSCRDRRWNCVECRFFFLLFLFQRRVCPFFFSVFIVTFREGWNEAHPRWAYSSPPPEKSEALLHIACSNALADVQRTSQKKRKEVLR
jgi:hypothetical protein